MFKRILVPLDGSTRAERALPVAARIARAADGSVILVQVATLPATYSTYLAALAYAESIEMELKHAEDYLNCLCAARGGVSTCSTTTGCPSSAAGPCDAGWLCSGKGCT